MKHQTPFTREKFREQLRHPAASYSYVDDKALAALLEAMWLCGLFEFCEPADDETDDVPHWRTAVHESGHALVALVEGTDFERVLLNDGVAGSEGRNRGELVPNRNAIYPKPLFEARVAVDVAGAAAEELVFDRVEPLGVWTDLRVALARAHVTKVDDPVAVEASAGLAWVREQVTRVRRMLRRRRRALEHLATELLRAGDLTRLDAVRLVRQAGTHVLVRPTRSSTVSRSELRDCDLVRAELADRTEGLPTRR
jgi:hypothetical protein